MSANNKELEDLLIEFDEMGYEPTTLVPNQEEAIKQFRNKLQALKQFIEGDCGEDVKEAIKRLRQETCPATYMPGFDKEECLQVIEQALQRKSKGLTKEAIINIIDDELEKRKENTFLLWDFPNSIKKRIEELDTTQQKSLAERCWEIVKTKRVSIVYLEDSLDVEQYNEFAFQTNGYASQLTKAEFETLKEGLK